MNDQRRMKPRRPTWSREMYFWEHSWRIDVSHPPCYVHWPRWFDHRLECCNEHESFWLNKTNPYRPSLASTPCGLSALTNIPSFSKPLSAPTPIPKTLEMRRRRVNVKPRVLCLRSRTSFPTLPNLEKNDWLRSTTALSFTFFDIHLENIHFLDALFQFVFRWGRKRIDVFIASIVFTGRVRQINLWFTRVPATKRALLPSYSDRCRTEFHSSVISDDVFLEFGYAWLLEEQRRW